MKLYLFSSIIIIRPIAVLLTYLLGYSRFKLIILSLSDMFDENKIVTGTENRFTRIYFLSFDIFYFKFI